ncbi:MAG: hypothetical protein KJ062_17330, partial [Thermoanaerobaculia bacterium]|nr:hypothetical protein [Thermoanaerobaculia bacterium]
MHELHHVLLGHTRLFPRPTPAHNIAFDAVVNALLCTRFPSPAHVSFFLDLYGRETGPLRLLAPPAGAPVEDPGLRLLHELLYSASADVTCLEVFERLADALGPRAPGEEAAGAPGPKELLGSHGEEGDDAWGTAGPLDADVVASIRRIVEKWPPPPGARRVLVITDGYVGQPKPDLDGRVAAGPGPGCAVSEEEVAAVVRDAFARAGYGATFPPAPETLEVRFDLCLGPLEPDERLFRRVADDQVIGVGYACRGRRAGMVPLEQALARDFAKALEALRSGGREAGLGPDGKALVVVRGRHLVAVSLSLHHVPAADWLALCALAKEACLAVAAEYVASFELEPPGDEVDWLFKGAGSFDVGGPLGDNGLSGKKLV